MFENHRKSLSQHCEWSGQKFIENAKNGPFWRVFKPNACDQTVLPDWSVLLGQTLVENAKIEKFKCDILGNFQTLWNLYYFWYSSMTTASDPLLIFWVGRLYLVDQGRISAMLHDSTSSSLVGTINQINSQTLFSILGNVVGAGAFPWSIIYCSTYVLSSQCWCSSGCFLWIYV